MSMKKPTILFVCTGNVCRSPAAEFVFRELLGPAAARLVIRSAGTKAAVDGSIDPIIANLLARKGIEVSKFRPRLLDVAQIDQADLILTASTTHRATVARLRPSALHKTLTLKQLARYATHIAAGGQRPAGAEHRIPWILAAVPGARSRSAREASDSIPDPVGLGRRHYESAFDEVYRSCVAIAGLFADSGDVPASASAPAAVARR